MYLLPEQRALQELTKEGDALVTAAGIKHPGLTWSGHLDGRLFVLIAVDGDYSVAHFFKLSDFRDASQGYAIADEAVSQLVVAVNRRRAADGKDPLPTPPPLSTVR
ncbi:hypothetical protein [Caulobacter sp. Root343]|uniref:hypothetical protein n=1 Tax=Caulobacter sp. Root343 TaxID=1736520 RepID=UPI0006F34011|nr:hypothetical protein [Caulobacter sp. Root343]KQV66661.1 hypothetical protein ASC70_12570 [Caulobacter sp. Root343]